MLKGLSSAKRLLLLTFSLGLILSLTLLCAPGVFAVEYTVVDETAFRAVYAEAAAGDTITLTDNITLTQALVLDKNININCNNNVILVQSTVTISSGSITGTGDFILVVQDGGELRIQQNASISSGRMAPILVSSNAKLTMSGGNITASVYAIAINGGTVDLSGGTITLAATDIGIYIHSGLLEMSGGTITSTGNPNSCGVSVYNGTAVFTGGSIVAPYGVAILEGEITSSVPAQQLSGIYDGTASPILTTSPAAITMQRGQTRTVILSDADESFALFPEGTDSALNAEAAGRQRATLRPLLAGDYTLSFHATFETGNGQASITLNIPVTVTNPAPSNPGSPSTPTGQGDDTPSVPSIPETGAGNLFLLLLLSVLCI